ncbi:MAG TPA: M48 family metallopeptidase [Oxalicibacterium sp.]|nr:M48 family metallopeptidase [Oxalicibacterium sp.]
MRSLLQRIPPFGRLACAAIALLIAGCSTTAVNNQDDTFPDTSNTGTTTAAPAVNESAQLQTLRTLTVQQDRLYRVAAPLLVSNAPLCRSYARNLIGFSAKNKYSYSADYVQAAQALGFGDQLRVTGVLPGSGAARAGVMRGDILTTVEDKAMPQGENAEREAASILAPLVSQRASVKLGLMRGNRNLTLSVPLTLACGFGIELGNIDTVNAFSDGRRVLITRGMLAFARSDTELAYVLAKELAHNALRYPLRLRMTATVGGIIDNLIRITPDTAPLSGRAGVKPMPKDLDIAADTVSLYMLARAGYDVQGAHAFWARLAAQYPDEVLNGYTAIHPSTSARLANIDRVVEDIQVKIAKKQPLFP